MGLVRGDRQWVIGNRGCCSFSWVIGDVALFHVGVRDWMFIKLLFGNVYKELRCWFVMDTKRMFVFVLIGMFLFSMIGVVSAEDFSNEAIEAAESSITFAKGFFGTLLTPLFGEKEMLSRVFFALLLGMIIYSVVSVMFKGSSKTVQWIIAFAITALALLGLPSNFLEAVRTSYGAMGAAILVMIPFIIILVFSLRVRSVLLARMTWIFYAIYYLVMYIYEIATMEGGWLTTGSFPYLAGFLGGVMVFIFMSGIRRLIFKGEIEGIKEAGEKGIEKGKLLKELKGKELEDVYGS